MHHQFHARRPPGWLGRESATSDFSRRFQPAAMKSEEDPASLTFSLSLSVEVCLDQQILKASSEDGLLEQRDEVNNSEMGRE